MLQLGSVQALLQQQPRLSLTHFANKPHLTQLVASSFNLNELLTALTLDLLIADGFIDDLFAGCILASEQLEGRIGDLTIIADFTLEEYRFFNGDSNDEKDLFYRHKLPVVLAAFAELYLDVSDEIEHFFSEFVADNTFLFDCVNRCVYASYNDEPAISPIWCKNEQQPLAISDPNRIILLLILAFYLRNCDNLHVKKHLEIFSTQLQNPDVLIYGLNFWQIQTEIKHEKNRVKK